MPLVCGVDVLPLVACMCSACLLLPGLSGSVHLQVIRQQCGWGAALNIGELGAALQLCLAARCCLLGRLEAAAALCAGEMHCWLYMVWLLQRTCLDVLRTCAAKPVQVSRDCCALCERMCHVNVRNV